MILKEYELLHKRVIAQLENNKMYFLARKINEYLVKQGAVVWWEIKPSEQDFDL